VFKLGLKLWSTNVHYVSEAIRLYEHGFCDYIELFAVPQSFHNHVDMWLEVKNKTNITFVIHAAHLGQGVNFAQSQCFENNMIAAKQAVDFADALGASMIIFHPGTDGEWQETCRQIRYLNDARIIVENKPYYITPELVANGATYDEITAIIQHAQVRFCCDIGHAVCAANALHLEPITYIKSLISLRPHLFHLADGDWNGVLDQHDHLGSGTFKLNEIIKTLPLDSMITLEAVHDFEHSLKDFETDAACLRNIEKHCHHNSDGAEIAIRRAHLDDMHDVFALSNDDDVRKNSISSQKISWQDHVAWFQAKIKRDDNYFFVVRNNVQNFIGQVRFDQIEISRCFTISISISKEFRNKGLGSQIIFLSSQQLLKRTQVDAIYALIRPENEASVKAFSKAGYVVAGTTNVKGIDLVKMEYKQ
jgi:deoxyribonuclease IV